MSTNNMGSIAHKMVLFTFIMYQSVIVYYLSLDYH